jgi:hypothetical protein
MGEKFEKTGRLRFSSFSTLAQNWLPPRRRPRRLRGFGITKMQNPSRDSPLGPKRAAALSCMRACRTSPQNCPQRFADDSRHSPGAPGSRQTSTGTLHGADFVSRLSGTTERACYFTISPIDSRCGRQCELQNAGPKTMKLIEKIVAASAGSPDLCFGVRAARPQNARAGFCDKRADFPREMAKHNFAIHRGLAQKQCARAQRLDKIIPRLAKNRQIIRETRPHLWMNWPKTVKKRFPRDSAKWRPPA